MKKKTKNLFVLLIIVLLFAVGCKSTDRDYYILELHPKLQEEVVAPEEVAIEEPVIVEPLVVDEPVVIKEPEPVELEKIDFTYNYGFSYGGYDIKIEAHNGYGYVTYPTFITDAEIAQAIGRFVAVHGDFGVTYKKVASGVLEVQYAENLTKADFDYIGKVAADDLKWYLDQMFAPAPVVDEPVVEDTVMEPEPVVEEPAVSLPVVSQPVAAQPVVEQQPVVEEKKSGSALLVIFIILIVILAALYCYFCLYKKLTVKQALEEIKKVFKK